MLAIKTILHPTDFSERSGYAYETARAFARDYGARLVVVHVASPPPAGSPKEEHQQALQEKLRWLQPKGAAAQLEPLLREGDAKTEILRAAEECKCDLIVMGTHGRTDARRQALGSVAEEVIRKAPCPVVVVRIPYAKAVAEAGASPEVAMTTR